MYTYNEKLEILKNIRVAIKKKKFILDESIDRFGFDDLTLLHTVKNKDEVKGYPFVASKNVSKVLKGLKLGLKIVPLEIKYEKEEHPIDLEFLSLKEFTESLVYTNITPHITFYLGSQKVTNRNRALKFLNLKRLEVEEKIRKYSKILISEFVPGGCLNDWIRNVYDKDESISDIQWKYIVFQLIYTLAVIQNKYKFMHNDFHYGNILIDNSIKKEGYFVYEIKRNGQTTKWYVKNLGIIPKVWDCEFGMCYSNSIEHFYPNKFVIGNKIYDKKTHTAVKPPINENLSTETSTESNVPYNYNETYDLHYFLTSLLDLYISKELFDWILNLYPEELIPKDTNSSYTTSNTSDTNNSSDSDIDSDIDSEDSDINSNETGSDMSDMSDMSDTTDLSKEISELNANLSANLDISENISCDDSEIESIISSESSYNDPYLAEGRMRNGVEKEFNNIPTPVMLLDSEFFEEMTKKPVDFEESTAVYFKYEFI